ncbi:NUDIX hydrolase [Paenibacillus sp. SYP-B3998]|uniref:NUDIX hydrolase n=1 Tax=Paenibacillus sp. SYP-B3998 TaxID=2678564 RepID=A0A6G3ZVC6_9BACL|nr:NUDIX hydrolase [Paenibacillus sp. SYP-B3998]NEW06163.1 NUDIX hydrolase [Paenibacillus sp. SYP-B3998]
MTLNKKFEEITLSSEPIFKGRVISLQVDTVQLPNGEQAKREIVKHPGAVAVIPLLDDKMIVVEQYRKPLEKSQVEIPAGKLDEGEEPLQAALRELEEETGYRSEHVKHVSSFYTSPGFADEIVHLYVAEQLIKGEIHLDEDEFLECEAITLEEAQRYIHEGRISDAKTILAVYAWQLYKLTGKI